MEFWEIKSWLNLIGLTCLTGCTIAMLAACVYLVFHLGAICNV